jgi:hypothetical protein
VTENVTGLVWEGTAAPGSYTQTQAATYCASKNGTWRLPTILELVSLVDFTVAHPGPAINQTYFPNTPSDYFWTSTPLAIGAAWYVNFNDGSTNSSDINASNRVRCVHLASPKCYPTRYEAQAGKLVFDRTTRLTWQQNVAPDMYAWTAAMTYCTGLGNGWRLPSLPELQSIVDHTIFFGPIINQTYFPNTPSYQFWTSSPYAGGSGDAWFVSFEGGYAMSSEAATPFNVRCVR